MEIFDYVIIGAGTHGLSSAFHLSNHKDSSCSVGIFEQYEIGHGKGSSHG